MRFVEYELGQINIDVIDGDRGKNYPHQNELLESGSCVFLSANNVTSTGFKFDSIVYITEEKDKLLRNGKLNRNDIVITTRGTVGNIALYDDTVPFNTIRINSGMLIVRCHEGVDAKYLYNVLRGSKFQNQIQQIKSGTAQPQLPKSHFLKMRIELPPLDKQKKIAEILSVIDAKIKTNVRINMVLQQQAFTFFERLLSQPDGDLCMLKEIAELNPKRQLIKGVVARCIDMAQLSTSGTFPSGWEMKQYNGGMRFSNGDTIIARITPCLENGKAAFIDFLNDSEVAFGSTEYIVISTKGIYPPEFFYCLARYPSFIDYAVKNMNGSSGRQRVSADILGNYLLPQLNKDDLSLFTNTVTVMFQQIRNNSLENIQLETIRNALLPKLMSGKLDISEIDL